MSVEFPEARIIVFAKAPIPGQAKTRMIPELGAKGAAQLHERLVHHTLNTVTDANLCPVELWSAGEISHPFFIDCQQHYSLVLKQQQGTDLGDRMGHAFIETLKHSPYALLVGTDAPTLSKSDLHHALTLLNEGWNCVLNPAEDGGYVSIGLNRFDTTLFHNIAWGGDTVMRHTRQRLQQLGWRWRELDTHHDIDRPDDLAFFPELFSGSPHE